MKPKRLENGFRVEGHGEGVRATIFNQCLPMNVHYLVQYRVWHILVAILGQWYQTPNLTHLPQTHWKEHHEHSLERWSSYSETIPEPLLLCLNGLNKESEVWGQKWTLFKCQLIFFSPSPFIFTCFSSFMNCITLGSLFYLKQSLFVFLYYFCYYYQTLTLSLFL